MDRASNELASDGKGAEQFNQQAQARALFTETEAAFRYDAQFSAEASLAGIYEQGQMTINMLA